MDDLLFLDTETRSEIDLKTAGTDNYAEGAEIMLVTYAFGENGPVQEWDLTDPLSSMPEDLYQYLAGDGKIVIHNSRFDRTVANATGQLGHHIHAERLLDTMVMALAHGLPGSLDSLSDIFKLGDSAKDKRGKVLIRMFCVRQKTGKKKGMWLDRNTNPVEWQELIDYAKQDITAMRELYKRLPKVNYPNNPNEYKLWLLDQRMNDRGFEIDMDLVHNAQAITTRAKKELASEMNEETFGEVTSATKTAALARFLQESYGITLPDMTGPTIERRLNDPDIPEGVRILLLNREEASRTAVTKYKTLSRVTCSDNRLRGSIQFCGANRTGRDAGRMFQPQNLPRPTMSEEEVEEIIAMTKVDALDMFHDKPLKALSNAVRGAIIAGEGRKLVVSDLSNIEGRGVVWLAGEDWKLKYFEAFDRGEIQYDNYVVAYAKAFGTDESQVGKDGPHKTGRQLGKIIELACGFGGGVGGLYTFSQVYRADPAVMARAIYASSVQEQWTRAGKIYDWVREKKGKTFGLTRDQYAAFEYLKTAWRNAHPNTAAMWKAYEDAFRSAMLNPNTPFSTNRVVFKRTGSWMTVRLPSGRYLMYLHPKIDDSGTCTYMGVNQYTRKWQPIKTYGGKLAENITQAVARDVLFYAIPAVEEAGYPVVLRVHDELLTEPVDRPEYSDSKLAQLMSTQHSWCLDLPLAAKGFETYRYKKD